MRGNRVENEEKVERSIPVSARVDLATIARLDRFWTEQGKRMRSISQIISWSLELLIETMEDNSLIEKDEELKDIQVAFDYLSARGVMQRGMKERGRMKIQNCMTMRNLRKEGVEPASVNGRAFNILHNERSVEVYDGRVEGMKIGEKIEGGTEIDWNEIEKQVNEEKEKEKKEAIRKGIETIKNINSLTEEKND